MGIFGPIMDENSNTAQHTVMFEKLDNLSERVTKIEVYQKIQYRDHGKLEEKHSNKLETQGKKLNKHGDLITRACAGGVVVLYVLEKMGVFGKLSG